MNERRRHRCAAWRALGLPYNDARDRYVDADPDDPFVPGDDELLSRLPATAAALAAFEVEGRRRERAKRLGRRAESTRS